MKLADNHPHLIAAAIAATGGLFLVAGIIELPFLQADPPGVYFMLGLASAFILGGGYFLLKARQGDLKPRGITVTDIRKQAIEKMESPELLSQIAREDPKPEVRKKAMKRLEKIAT